MNQRISRTALAKLNEKRAEKHSGEGKIAEISAHPGYAGTVEYKTELVAAHELLGVTIKELGTPRGKPLQVTVNVNTPYPEFVPEAKKNYVYGDFDLIKDIFMMLEIGIQAISGVTQEPVNPVAYAAMRPAESTTRSAPSIRRLWKKHTLQARSSLAMAPPTFEPGLLALAMKNGWVYLADEYDFAFPQILGVYQPVLEGEPLIIKEATPDWRRITPHKRFAFIGTGNTNGSGDETGLYQGTQHPERGELLALRHCFEREVHEH